MTKNITLTLDEIHEIRKEHDEKTKNMSFNEYKKSLNAEIAPILLKLNAKKKINATQTE